MNFARPDLLPLVVALPLALGLAVWLYGRRRRRVAAVFSDPHLLARLGGDDLLRFPLRRLVLLVLAATCLGVAAAGPYWGYRATEGSALSMNGVFAIDISKSMLAADIEPNRLERARLFTRRLLRELPGDRFGLVVFAGRAYVLSPLTVDHGALTLFIEALDPTMVSQGGSSVAAALTQATDLVRGAEGAGGDKVVVLLSDGEALESHDGVRAAAERAARAGIRVITVGIGTPRGATVPNIDPETGLEIGMIRDEMGEIVVSRLDEDLLRMIASRTGGSYVRIDDAAALAQVAGELRGMARASGDAAQRLEPVDRFAAFAALALILLAVDMVMHGLMARAAAARVPVPEAAPERAAPPSGRWRRRLTHAAVLTAVLIGTGFGIGDLERGNRLYREGRYEEAVAAYQRVVDAGRASPQVHYNLGTALLAVGRYDDAEQHFQAALRDVDPELRQRTFYNLGNRFLTDARSTAELQRQGSLLDAAIESYRRALRVNPDDLDAKWNLELALRDREQNEQNQRSMPQQQQPDQQSEDEDQQQQQPQAGGGSGASRAESQAGEGQDTGMDMEQRPMSEAEAERILSAMEQDERELMRDKLRRGQRRTPVLRDW